MFWAQGGTLGYLIEDNSPLIEKLLAAGAVDKGLCVEFQGRLFWRDAAAVRIPRTRTTRSAVRAWVGGCCSIACQSRRRRKTGYTSTSMPITASGM